MHIFMGTGWRDQSVATGDYEHANIIVAHDNVFNREVCKEGAFF